jgi:chromosome segregation ATPase
MDEGGKGMTDKLFEDQNGLQICTRHGLIRCGDCAEIEEYREEIESLRSQLSEERKRGDHFEKLYKHQSELREELIRQATSIERQRDEYKERIDYLVDQSNMAFQTSDEKLQQAEQERDEYKDLTKSFSEDVRMWRKSAENLFEANTAMREDLKTFLEYCDHRIQELLKITDNPESDIQQSNAAAKGAVFQQIKRELESILSRYPKEGGELNETNRGN